MGVNARVMTSVGMLRLMVGRCSLISQLSTWNKNRYMVSFGLLSIWLQYLCACIQQSDKNPNRRQSHNLLGTHQKKLLSNMLSLYYTTIYSIPIDNVKLNTNART